MLMAKGHPVMLVGSAGSGKTVVVNDKLGSLPESYVIANVPFNFYTTSEMLQRVSCPLHFTETHFAYSIYMNYWSWIGVGETVGEKGWKELWSSWK